MSGDGEMSLPEGCPDGPRGCLDHEVGAALDLASQVIRLDEGGTPTVGSDYPHVYCGANRDNIRIIKVAGRVVATVALHVTEVNAAGTTLRVAGLNCLATRRDHRRNGYGSAVVEDFHKRMRELDADVGWLTTDVPDWYRRLGWEKAGRQNTYTLDRGNVGVLPGLGDREVACGHEDFVGPMADLQSRQPLGARRSARHLKLLLDRPSAERWERFETRLALQGGEPDAFIIASGKTVIEHAGPPEIVAGLIRRLFERNDDPAISTSDRNEAGRVVLDAAMRVNTPATDDGLSDLFDRLGVPAATGYVGLLRIADLPRLLSKLGLDAIKVRQSADTAVLTRGDEECELTARQQVKLVFGPERVRSFAEDLFPVPFYHWPLDYV